MGRLYRADGTPVHKPVVREPDYDSMDDFIVEDEPSSEAEQELAAVIGRRDPAVNMKFEIEQLIDQFGVQCKRRDKRSPKFLRALKDGDEITIISVPKRRVVCALCGTTKTASYRIRNLRTGAIGYAGSTCGARLKRVLKLRELISRRQRDDFYFARWRE